MKLFWSFLFLFLSACSTGSNSHSSTVLFSISKIVDNDPNNSIPNLNILISLNKDNFSIIDNDLNCDKSYEYSKPFSIPSIDGGQEVLEGLQLSNSFCELPSSIRLVIIKDGSFQDKDRFIMIYYENSEYIMVRQ